MTDGAELSASTSSSPSTAASTPKPRVLLVDDEPAIIRSFGRTLRDGGYEVTCAQNGREAIDVVASGAFEAIVSDIRMPDLDGLGFLRAIRARQIDVPVIFLTGSPSIETATEALEQGAFRYLLKPIAPPQLVEAVQRAVTWGRVVQVRKEVALELDDAAHPAVVDLELRFQSALDKLWMAFQPIVAWQARAVHACEALVRTDEASLRNPVDLFDAAERLGRMHELGRSIRNKVADIVRAAPTSSLFFVNLHPRELLDPELVSHSSPLAEFAKQIVFEVTERAPLNSVAGVHSKIKQLRDVGYRIALDDMGAGYAGLSTFAQLEPDIVKIDMSLVRGLETSPIKQKLFRSMRSLSAELGVAVVTEGIETPGERDCAVSLGGDLFQGYLFGRPARGLPEVRF